MQGLLVKGPDKRKACIHQYPHEVCGFSSQYGGENSLAYVAANILGPPTVYPSYGDVTHACVFRTYGPWWDMVPSSIQKFSNCQPDFYGQDFIDLKLETPVIPEKIKIYQTYHPQSVIQIYGAMISYSTNGVTSDARWYELWTQDPEIESRHEAIIFEPSVKHPPNAINVIRLILYSKHLEYYNELDAVEVIGSIENDIGTDLDEEYVKKFEKLHLHSESGDNRIHAASHVNFFEKLPGELISLIFSNLNFLDLCSAARTCRLFRDHCYDSLLLLELDLQPYWQKVTSQLIESLHATSRVSQIQKLSVSWCAFGNNTKFSAALSKLISDFGRDLQVLRIQGCMFTLDEVLLQVATKCERLSELDLSSSLNVSNSYICVSQLNSLTRLDLYRSCIDDTSLTEIIQANPHLEHLNVGNVTTIQNFDLVASTLGKNCKKLRSLNLWRARSLTSEGVRYISQNCRLLEELDIGWCSHIQAQSNCFITLVQCCQKLKKLFLTSIRTTRDCDIDAIAHHCTILEQFDILGTNYVTPSSISRFLSKCQKLVFLDVSFCKQISDEDVQYWRSLFPNVSIKKSHTTNS